MKSGKSFNRIVTILTFIGGAIVGWMQNHQLIYETKNPKVFDSSITQYRLKINNKLLVVYSKKGQFLKYATGTILYEGECLSRFNPVSWTKESHIYIECGVEKSTYSIDTHDRRMKVTLR